MGRAASHFGYPTPPIRHTANYTTMLRAPTLLSHPDVTIIGAGVIGLTLALELHARGAKVTLLERGPAAAQASWAAAGMLAAQDPHNPRQLQPLADLSTRLYPAFLEELEELSGLPVPFQTEITVQTLPDGSVTRLRERSIDPRQLAMALITAVQRSSAISFIQNTTVRPEGNESLIKRSGIVVHATGAWAADAGIAPRKGQMLRVHLPLNFNLREVYRTDCVYVVPRTQGPQAGTALIGATVEDVGYDTTTCPDDLAGLRRLAAALVPHHPELADSTQTPIVEAWAGLRPATPDDLPLLGNFPHPDGDPSPRHFIAAGHFRNGILLAPATAVLLADLIDGHIPPVDLSPFSPARFTRAALAVP